MIGLVLGPPRPSVAAPSGTGAGVRFHLLDCPSRGRNPWVLLGFVTPDGTGYVHLIATRDDARGTGLGRRLYAAFAEAAERLGARRLKAITSIENTGSIAFHRSLGFDTKVVDDYNGRGRAMAVFHRDLQLNISQP